MRIVLATSNAGKLREIAAVFAGVSELAQVQFLTLHDVGLAGYEYDEVGDTFAANAIGKAAAVAELSGLPAIADDSGLCVDALGGAPGVRSARWAGASATDGVRNEMLLKLMADVPDDRRTARFVCAAAVSVLGENYCITEGTSEGLISSYLKGAHGFGYDPLFWLPEFGCTMAELSADEKNRISHRGKALYALIKPLCELKAEWSR